MVSEKDKFAILDGEYGITRDGNKCKYVGLSTDDEFPYVFVKYNSSDRIIDVKNLGKDLVYYSGETHPIDVVGLWIDKSEPFDLDRALAGEPVMLRNGFKAYITYIMPDEYIGHYPLGGYMVHGDTRYTYNWSRVGEALVGSGEQPNDVISMWKEPEPASNTMTFTLPRALKEPQDEMWYLTGVEIVKSAYCKNIPSDTFANRPYFGSEEDAKAWFDAMQDSRK